MEDKHPNQPSMMERAIEALERYDGMGIVPLIEGRKEPIEKLWALSACHTPADVATAWTDYPNANIGVVAGEEHLVLDIDTKHMNEGIDPWDSIKRLESDGASFGPTLKIKTPTDGEHWVYRVQPTPQRKKAIGFLPGLDLLTGTNFIVAAGSVIDPDAYPENPGGTYAVIEASPVDVAPNLLADIFYVEEKRRESAKDRLKRTTTNFDVNLIKNWNGSTLYPTDLWRTVWSVVVVRSGFMRFLKGEPRVPTFEKGERHNALASLFGWMRYQPFRNYEHWEKSCRIAANLVAPTYELDDHKGLAALIQDYWEYPGSRPLDELKDGQFTWESDEEYERRLEEGESKKAVPFPIEVFPRDVRNLVTGLAESYHIPTDYSAIPILAVASTAVGGTAKVSIKGWTQPINIYAISVGRPGSGKQEGADKVMNPIYVEEDRRRAVYEDEMDRYEAGLKAWKIANSVWESKYKSWFKHEHYTKGEQGHSCQGDCPTQAPEKIVEEPEKPSLSHIHATEGTTESLGRGMARSAKFAVLTDEISGTILGLNQYKGGKGSDKAFYMNAWKGTPTVILRADEDRIVDIPNPFLTVYGTIQPDVARILLNDKGWDDGFLDRWLFAYPSEIEAGLPGKADLSQPKLIWNNAVAKMLSVDFDESGEPRTIRLDDGALVRWTEWQQGFADDLNAGAEPRGPLVKLSQYVMRFIGILHLIRWSVGKSEYLEVATVEDVEGAISLFEYFRRGLVRPLGDVVRVRRGVATGANTFFFIRDEDIDGIPREAIRPALYRMRYATNDILDARAFDQIGKEGFRRWLLDVDRELVEGSPSLRAWVRRGRSESLHLRTLTSQRHPWYSMEQVAPPDVIIGSMGKSVLRVVENSARCVPSNSMYGLYFTDESVRSSVTEWLRSPEGQRAIRRAGRNYGRGLIKVEPRELLSVRLPSRVLQ